MLPALHNDVVDLVCYHGRMIEHIRRIHSRTPHWSLHQGGRAGLSTSTQELISRSGCIVVEPKCAFNATKNFVVLAWPDEEQRCSRANFVDLLPGHHCGPCALGCVQET